MNSNKTGRKSGKGDDDLELPYVVFCLLLGKDIGTGKAKRSARTEEIARLNERLESLIGYTIDNGMAGVFFAIAEAIEDLWPDGEAASQGCRSPEDQQKGGNDVG
jgi:hypothetical protein